MERTHSSGSFINSLPFISSRQVLKLIIPVIFLNFLPLFSIHANSLNVDGVAFFRSDTISPQIVRPERDGSLRLGADNGKGIGPGIKYMPEWEAFGWFTAADLVVWDVVVGSAGTYEVFMEWSVSDKEAGKPFLFEAGGRKLSGKVQTTGSWEKFKTESLGTIELQAGNQKMVFKPNSQFDQGALLDLRGLKLVPVQ